MRTPVKLAAYGLGLAVVFGASLGAGALAGPAAVPAPEGRHGAAEPHDAEAAGHGGSGTNSPGGTGAGSLPGGLQVAQDGYRLVPATRTLGTSAPVPFSFHILGPDGAPVTAYTPTHEKALHLIVVRRDLSGFQHLHPTMAGDGLWTAPVSAGAPGAYRVFADFRPAGRDTALTLGVDVAAPGPYEPVALPAPGRTTTVDGYTVTLAGDLVPGSASTLTLTVSRDGRPVTDLDPYLGAYGHLVVLREGDLAYLHVHPEGSPGDGRAAAGPGITFAAQVPSAGGYRLYLDFQHAGVVRTAEFTATAGTRPDATATAPADPPAPTDPPATSGPPETSGPPKTSGTPGHGHP